MTYLITGASRGIGLELTRQVLASGQNVIAAARDPLVAKDLMLLADKNREHLQVCELDVSADKSVHEFAAKLPGDLTLDVLINNAGVYLDTGASSLASLKMRTVEETFATNVLGPMRVTQALEKFLARAKTPVVINTSSLMGSITDNAGGSSYAYRMSKTALNMFTKNLAVEHRDWTVISVHPGWVQTEMGGSGASVPVADSARGILKLAAGASSKQSGHFFNYTGSELPW